ncbi:universal stress protein [Marinobacteraceae bacterium S3BR75-40.1]
MPLSPDRKLKALYACDPFRPLDQLDPGGHLIDPGNVTLLVAMVCEVPEESLAWFRKRLMPPKQLRRQVAAREVELQRQMYDITQKLESLGYEVDSRVERGKSTGQVIADVAEEEAVDLIIVDRRRQTPWQRFLLGSVADYVSRHATQPLLIMPPPKS